MKKFVGIFIGENFITQGITKKKRVLSRILAMLMLFLQLPTFNFTAKAAGVSSGIDLSSTSGWTQVYPANAQNDLQGDQQTGGSSNSVSQDIVGDATYPSTYMKFSDDRTEFAIRIRVNNYDGTSSTNPEFKNFAFVGVDSNGNGTVDFFLGVYNPTGSNGRLGIYDADTSALNAGPSTTGISGKPLMAFAPVKGVNYSIIQADSSIFGDRDYFITYKFKVTDISNAISSKTKENVTFTANTPFRFITGTAAQDNSFNQDISGMGKSGWSSGRSWLELNVFSPVVSVNGGSYNAVIFDKNTGDTDASPASKIIQSGNPIGTLPATNPTKRGMYFQGWNTSPDGTGTAVTVFTTINTDTTVYAMWSSKPVYTVTFNIGTGAQWSDGSTANKTISTINGIIGDNMPSNPTKTNNYFIGWGTSSSLNSATIYDSQTQISGSITLYALWDNNAAKTATFYNNIGLNGGQVITKLYTNPSGQVQSTPSPTRVGYTFNGWYDNPNCTGSSFTGGKIDLDTSFYAKWTQTTYTLTYDRNDITNPGTSSIIVSNGKFIVPSEPTRVGYIFLEWNRKADGTGEPMYATSDITADTTVYAIWQQIVKITFDANGGNFDSGSPTVIDVKNKKLTQFPIPPTKNNNTFLGWSTSSTSTTLVSLTGDFNSSTTLYAVWSPVYTVTFNANGGGWDGNITSKDVLTAYGNVLYYPDEPTQNGYLFNSWNILSTGMGATFNTNTDVTDNITVYAKWTIKTYNLTYTAGANGSITGTTPQTVAHGSSGTAVTAVPAAGYHFVSWSDGVTTATRTDSNVTGGVSVTANFAAGQIAQYTLSYAAGLNGSIAGDTSQIVNHGSNGTAVTAVPATGYHFVCWSDGKTTAARTDINVTDNVTVTASFAINEFTLSYTAGANGSITGTTPQTVAHGSNGTSVTAVPAAGYHFASWSDGKTDATRTDSNVTGDINVTASFAADQIAQYTLTYTAGLNGSITGNTSQTVSSGESGTSVIAVPAAGYHFVEWSDGIKTATRTDSNVTDNVTVTANFDINQYTLSYTAGANGSITGAATQTVDYGSNGTEVTAVPAAGYHFVEWSDGVKTAARTDSNVVGNINVTASFAINEYTLSYTAGANGSITGSTSQTVSSGGSGTSVTAVPATGYHFVSWSDGKTDAIRTDSNVMGDISVTASFAINQYTLSYTAGASGSITGSASQTVDYGSSGTEVTAVPATGYHFVSWSDGKTIAARTDINMTDNVAVTASFAINEYTLSYTAGANGSITGSTSQTVAYGSNGTEVTAVPAAGYHFVSWSDGKTTAARTDINMTDNVTLIASFAINQYTLSYTAGASGSITGSASQTVNHGSNGTAVTAVPAAGYHFVEWSDGVKTATRTDSNIAGNINVTAGFAINQYSGGGDSYEPSPVPEPPTPSTPPTPEPPTVPVTPPAPVEPTITAVVVDNKNNNNNTTVEPIKASVTANTDGTDIVTVKPSEAILLKQPDGTKTPLEDYSNVKYETPPDVPVAVKSDGTVEIQNLAKGNKYDIKVTFDFGEGQKINIGIMHIEVDNSGNVNMISELIDPYGTLSNSLSGKTIPGTTVTLYYADTERNRISGKTPNTIVKLPIIQGFKPNDNNNPQLTDSNGTYGFMVYPDTDYYILGDKDGYDPYSSRTISVGKDLVKFSARLNPPITGIVRVSGDTRIDTAINIAKAEFIGKVKSVILATADNYPDALAGSVLAYQQHAPILLVGASKTDQDKVLNYIKDYLETDGTVFILGGTGVVTEEFANQVKASGYNNILRLGGLNRYETAVKIAEYLNVEEGTPVVVVSGENYPDALSISSSASINQYPILLVTKDGISESVKSVLAKIKPSKVYVIGKQGAVSDIVQAEVVKLTSLDNSNLVRIGGADRYETSVEVAKYFKLSGRSASLTTGSSFPDALAGSVYSANYNAPILLVGTTLTNEEKLFLQNSKLTGITIFGGEGAVNKQIQNEISSYLSK